MTSSHLISNLYLTLLNNINTNHFILRVNREMAAAESYSDCISTFQFCFSCIEVRVIHVSVPGEGEDHSVSCGFYPGGPWLGPACRGIGIIFPIIRRWSGYGAMPAAGSCGAASLA